jgi:uncharacterized membrane protein
VANLNASRSVEIHAPLDRVYEIASDVPGADRWRNQVVSINVLETDAEGRATLVEEVTDAKVKKVTTRLRFSYSPPSGLSWEQEKGEMKWLKGNWRLEDLGDGRTKATFSLEADPGRMLGLLLRGPAMGIVSDLMTKDPTDGLKKFCEDL